MEICVIQRALILVTLAAVCAIAAPAPECETDQFMDYIGKNNMDKIRTCLRNNETYYSLCRGELHMESRGPEWPIAVLARWRQLCDARPEYNVTGSVTFGGSGGIQHGGRREIQDGGRQEMRLNGLTTATGRLPPGRYIAVITVSDRTRIRKGSLKKSAAMKKAPKGSTAASGQKTKNDRTHKAAGNAGKSQDVKGPDLTEFTPGLAEACSVANTNMDACFRQGFNNARIRLQKMDPLQLDVSLKGGSKVVNWAVVGNVTVTGISNYTVKSSRAQTSGDPSDSRLAITTEWVAPRWTVELGLVYHLAVIPGVVVLNIAAKVVMQLSNVKLLNSMDVWGQQQPEQGVVRFFTEDKQFRVTFDAEDAKTLVTIHNTTSLSHFGAMNELVRLHFKHVALNAIWPTTEKKLGNVIKEVVNGGVVPGVINFLLTRGAPPRPARQQAARRRRP